MTSPAFSSLTQQEWDWIDHQLDEAQRFVAAQSPGNAQSPLTLEALDRAWAAWLAQPGSDEAEVNRVINAVGIQFGAVLVERAGFNWTIVTDAFGTDLAIVALPGRGDVTVVPANFVAKRWEQREEKFLAASYAVICDQVARIAASWSKPTKRRWWQFWR